MRIMHVIGLIIHPQKEWQKIRLESTSIPRIYLTYIFLLAAIPILCNYIGTTQIGWYFNPDKVIRLSSDNAATIAIMGYLALLGGVFVVGLLIHQLSQTYSASTSLAQCVVFSAYTATPLFVLGIAGLYPAIWVYLIAGIIAAAYTTYLLYAGLPIVMNIPKEQGFFFASSILCVGLVAFVSLLVIAVLLLATGIGPGVNLLL
ncbi:YIP1 family protein [Zooshikella marina]|uniref:YIP1 family protein n=1 Tax=Zooshikella ganghwensis TaxID=202772 RepID=A0A4P9VL49_9GAMM|nr:Yip1 family protein [Zooshikella ganghwensis]MBU2704544.1 YIP1 family protein [Zooshikella ganghwensis]RDH43269.1 YIP1 family protein [Zooshikella ganghwensis]